MSQPSNQKALREILVFLDITDSAIEKLTTMGEVLSVEEGTLLFNEGEQHGRVYFVASGSVKLEMVTARCGRQTILTAGTGDLLAWSALLGDGVMTATAIAAEATSLVEFNADALRKELEMDHEFGYQFMQVVAKSLSRRLLATRLQLLDLFRA